jgi:hypothetical protein
MGPSFHCKMLHKMQIMLHGCIPRVTRVLMHSMNKPKLDVHANGGIACTLITCPNNVCLPPPPTIPLMVAHPQWECGVPMAPNLPIWHVIGCDPNWRCEKSVNATWWSMSCSVHQHPTMNTMFNHDCSIPTSHATPSDNLQHKHGTNMLWWLIQPWSMVVHGG